MTRKSICQQIFDEMRNIRLRLDDIENRVTDWTPQPLKISESKLMALPDHLRQTFLAVASKGESTSTMISNMTGRSRAIESHHLNLLARMGWLSKRKISRARYFRVVSASFPK